MRTRSSGRSRGFSHVSTTLEAAAIMGWFVILVLGEKLVSDSTTARRAVEDTAEQSAVASSAAYCESNVVLTQSVGGVGPRGSVNVGAHGGLDISNLVSLLAGLGLGSQRTFQLFTLKLQSTTARAEQGDVHGAPQVGGATYDFYGERTRACQERPKDVPETSIDQYRKSIFNKNILGY